MIVANGRSYINNSVLTKITGGSETRKISSIRFGTGLAITNPGTTALTSIVSFYSTALVSSTKWFDVAAGKLYTYTTTWDNGVAATAVGLIANRPTAILIPVSGNTYFATDESKLYTYTSSWNSGVLTETTLHHINNLSTDNGIGLQIDVIVSGSPSASTMISELGLFLDDNSMFSRVIFEPTPFTNATSYKMTYTVYF
jgi:hypothetical protein